MSIPHDDPRVTALADALRATLRNRGDGLTRPFRRTFDLAGLTPTLALPAAGDGAVPLAAAVLGVADGAPEPGADGVVFEVGGRRCLVRVDTEAVPALGHFPSPDAYVLLDGTGRFTTSHAEVLAQLVGALREPAPSGPLPGAHDEPVQVRPPEDPLTGLHPYVGSRTWGIHSEAVGDEWVRRGVAAVAAAIEAAGPGRPVAPGGRSR